ncbi:MAG: integration host factor subunit beta [Deltaproteobacteria bacterium]|jgi:integration host factor subunit beta|nr:integration host factor subunit beta [Deltaproteobacteria bacterium]
MNKSQLTQEFADATKLNVKVAEKVVNIFFDSIIDALLTGQRVELRGFSSFRIKHYPPYQGRNPKSGGAIAVKAKKMPFFKVGKELRNMVDQDRSDL